MNSNLNPVSLFLMQAAAMIFTSMIFVLWLALWCLFFKMEFQTIREKNWPEAFLAWMLPVLLLAFASVAVAGVLEAQIP